MLSRFQSFSYLLDGLWFWYIVRDAYPHDLTFKPWKVPPNPFVNKEEKSRQYTTNDPGLQSPVQIQFNQVKAKVGLWTPYSSRLVGQFARGLTGGGNRRGRSKSLSKKFS
jgi:hypothetical protein